MWPFTGIGTSIGEHIAGAFNAAMLAIWDAGIAMLAGAFHLVDGVSGFTLSTTSGPVATLWPLMLWVSGVLALGLFFWQLVLTNLHAGRGFLRLITGPAQYGIALAITVGLAAGLLTGVDGLTHGILDYGLGVTSFSDALNHLGFTNSVHNGVSAIVLCLCAMFMVYPAAIGFLLEMIFREGALYTLVVCIPITAAGLLAVSTHVWFWKVSRWMVALIVMKPALATTLVMGVVFVGNAPGFDGVLAGGGVLLISLAAPFALFRLLVFLDPGTQAGANLRDFLSGGHRDGSYATIAPLRSLAGAARGGGGGGTSAEHSNTARLEQILREHTQAQMGQSGTGAADDAPDDGPDGWPDPDDQYGAGWTDAGFELPEDPPQAAPPRHQDNPVEADAGASPDDGPDDERRRPDEF